MTTTRTAPRTVDTKDTAMLTTTAPTDDLTDTDALREVAEQGRRATETLAQRERERQERRTAELEREQAAYDRDLARRGPDVDADLDRQRDDALAALQSAVDAADLGAALQAWRLEAAARFAQRDWRSAWRTAYSRTGEGPVPPRESTRDAERDEMAGFLVAVAQAAESGARLDADTLAADLVGERPTARPDEVLPGIESALRHSDGCSDPSRTETTHPPVGRHSHGTVVRCISCTASLVVSLPPPEQEDVEASAPGPALMRRPMSADYLPAADAWPA